MSNTAFDTLGAARKLKASGLGAEQADAVVEAMSQSTSQFVTVKHFDAGIALLHSRNDALQTELRTRTDALQTELRTWTETLQTELRTRNDALQTELIMRIDALQTGLNAKIDNVQADLRTDIAGMRTEIWRSILIAAGVIIAAVGLMMTVLGLHPTSGLPLPLPPP